MYYEIPNTEGNNTSHYSHGLSLPWPPFQESPHFVESPYPPDFASSFIYKTIPTSPLPNIGYVSPSDCFSLIPSSRPSSPDLPLTTTKYRVSTSSSLLSQWLHPQNASVLEQTFTSTPRPSLSLRKQLATELDIPLTNINKFFTARRVQEQSRKARAKEQALAALREAERRREIRKIIKVFNSSGRGINRKRIDGALLGHPNVESSGKYKHCNGMVDGETAEAAYVCINQGESTDPITALMEGVQCKGGMVNFLC